MEAGLFILSCPARLDSPVLARSLFGLDSWGDLVGPLGGLGGILGGSGGSWGVLEGSWRVFVLGGLQLF